MRAFSNEAVCITKTEKAESEAQRDKPKGTLESESRNAMRGGAVLTTVEGVMVCVLPKRKKQKARPKGGKPKGTLESESRNAIV